MDSGKVVVGVLAGVAIGALVGILFAPDKGSATRSKISKKTSDTVNDAKNKIASLMDGLAEKFETEKEELAEAYDKVKGDAKKLVKDVKNA